MRDATLRVDLCLQDLSVRLNDAEVKPEFEDEYMRRGLALAVVALPLAIAGCSHPERAYYAPPPPSAYADIAQRGFHDGFDAARHDMARGVRPDVDRHERFRNPPVASRAFDDYRHGFREGYQRAIRGDSRGY
jgi:hypothetical protein